MHFRPAGKNAKLSCIYPVTVMLFTFFMFSTLKAATFFVAPDGDDTNPGTIDEPFATMQKGHDKASAGDTVFLRGGTYEISKGAAAAIGISITKSGKSDDERIYYWAYEDELPILDFSDLKLSGGIGAGIRVQGEWLHFKGLEIKNVKAPSGANNGIWCNPCTHNIFEELDLHHIQGPGLSIANGEGDLLILNCDAHDNFDVAKGGEDADGFGVHYQTKGDTIRFKGCRAWWCSDDGYDFFKQQFPCVVENCWAFGNGYTNEGTGNGANGAGFKMGNSFLAKIRHTIFNCVSWGNKNQGFYANHSPGGTNWYNNTAYNNRGGQFDMLSDKVLSGDIVHVLRNNIAFPEHLRNTATSDMEFNSWDLGIKPSEDDFESIDDEGWKGPRKPDGSLPDVSFLKLREASGFVDKGTDVGLPFAGEAPDLGAYETGMNTPSRIEPKNAHGFSSGASRLSPARTAAGYNYYDLTGRKLSRNRTLSGAQVIICKMTTGSPRPLLTLLPSR